MATPRSRRPNYRRRRSLAAGGIVAVLVAGLLALLLHLVGGPDRPAARSAPTTPTLGAPRGTSLASFTQPNWVRLENERPGTTAWQLHGIVNSSDMEGFASRVSVDLGQPVTLYVSTTARWYTLQAFRMGWYQGRGARLVWSAPGRLAGHVQPPPTISPGVHLVECHWSPAITVRTGPDWPPGDYLFKLAGSNGAETYIPLTVRDDASHAAIVLVNAVTTWQAYNNWGGYDLYQGPDGAFADRARVVSFDRPYVFGEGTDDFIGNELPLVRLVERLGLDVTYVTDVDLQQRPGLLEQHHAMVSLGHDEYWSQTMRDALTAAIAHGVNLAFLGANAIYRHIRFASSPLGPDREVICYKSTEDPLYGVDNAAVTVNWRDPPVPRPESTILGELYQCNPVLADGVVADASAWVFAGTGLRDGEHLHDLIGSEFDGYYPAYPGPRNVQLLLNSPVDCRGATYHANMTYYTAPSGAGVIDTGTSAWVCQLAGRCLNRNVFPDQRPAIIRITENVLRVFGAGPAATAHPSQPNAARLGVGGAPPAGAGGD